MKAVFTLLLLRFGKERYDDDSHANEAHLIAPVPPGCCFGNWSVGVRSSNVGEATKINR